MSIIENTNNIKITVQRSFLDINKWEMVVSERYSIVDIDAIVGLFGADIDTMIEIAKKYNGVYYAKNCINEYNGLLFDTKKECKQFIKDDYISILPMLLKIKNS